MLRVIAGLLLVPVALSAWKLSTASAREAELDAIDALVRSGSDDDAAWQHLADLADDELTSRQRDRRSRLRTVVLARLLRSRATIGKSGGPSIPLGGGAIRIPVRTDRATLTFAVPAQPRALATVKSVVVDDRDYPLDAQRRVVIDVAGDGKRFWFRTTTDLTPGRDNPWRLRFVRDDKPPSIWYSVAGENPADVVTDERIVLRDGDSVTLNVHDDSSIAAMTVTLDGKVLPDAPPARAKSFSAGLPFTVAAGQEKRVVVTAVDAAGSQKRLATTFVGWTPPLPELTRLEVEGSAVTTQRHVTRAPDVRVTLMLENASPEHTVTAVRAGRTVATFTLADDEWSAEVPAAGAKDAPVDLVVEEHVVRSIAIVQDVRAPEVSVLREADGDLCVSPIRFSPGEGFRLVVRETSGLDAAPRLDATAALDVGSSVENDGTWERPFRVNGAGELTVEARDVVGNEVRDVFSFAARVTTPPDDGKGPAVRLRFRGADLPGSEPWVFYGSTEGLTLEVEDTNGVAAADVSTRPAVLAELRSSDDGSRITADVGADETFSVTARDRFGNETVEQFVIVVITPSARIADIGGRSVTAGAVVIIPQLPANFSVATSEVVPGAALSASLERDGAELMRIGLAANRGTLPRDERFTDGPYRLVVRLDAVDGTHEIASVRFVLKASGPALTCRLGERELSDDERVTVRSLTDLAVRAEGAAAVTMTYDGQELELSGGTPVDPPRASTGGTLVITARDEHDRTTSMRIRVTAEPYTPGPATRSALDALALRIGTAAAGVTDEEVTALRDQIQRESRSWLNRGRALEEIDGLSTRLTSARNTASASGDVDDTGTSDDTGTGTGTGNTGETPTPSKSLPREIVNRRDDAVLRLIDGPHMGGVDRFYVYTTEVTRGMFLRFLEEDTRLTSRDGYDRRRRQERQEYLSNRSKPDLPIQRIDAWWCAAYAAWALEGIDLAGARFELPTAAQWALAAGRARHPDARFPSTDRFRDGSDLPDHRSGANWDTKRLTAVNRYAPGEFGVYGMAGNVIELCRRDRTSGRFVLKGGHHADDRLERLEIDATVRLPTTRVDERYIGFRLVLEP